MTGRIVNVQPGTRADALRFSLGANATHGKRREPGDYAKSYRTACKYGLVRPEDIEGVRALLECSVRWAYDLTAPERQKIDDARNAEIASRKAAGQSVRTIARETGVSIGTVSTKTGKASVQSLQTAKTEHPTPAAELPGQAMFNAMTTDHAERWWDRQPCKSRHKL